MVVAAIMNLTPAYRYRAKLVRIIDGDTQLLRVDLGMHISVDQPIRVHGVNTPELSTSEGKTARDWATAWYAEHPDLIIETQRDKMTFARYVADVYGTLPGVLEYESLAGALIAAGQGVSFMAG